jgi:bifunctional DNA-binding transcriptional regulator/antitoxin component of YhaV-PrlF toxin-antitoxin module
MPTITDLVKMSGKGQLVVPQRLRDLAGYKEGDRFIATIEDGKLTFKRVIVEERLEQFRKLTEKLQQELKGRKITEEDIDEAVRWVRTHKQSSTRISSSPRFSTTGQQGKSSPRASSAASRSSRAKRS